MNKIFFLLFTLIALCASPAINAELYKWVDEEGNISYSDEPPHKDAEKLDPPDLTTTPAVDVPEKKAEPEKEEEKVTKYTLFKITSPQNDATIRNNEGNFSVSLSIDPPLNTSQGHYFSLTIDGKSVAGKTSSTTTSLSNIDRGTHKITASVKDENGKVLRTAKSVIVHLHRATIKRKTPR